MRRVGRRRTQCPLDYLSNLIVVNGLMATRASFVKQTITAILQESAAPLANGVFMDAEFGCHRLAWQAIRTPLDRAAPLRQRPGYTMTTNLPLQVRPLLLTQHQRRDRPASQTCIRHKRSPLQRFVAGNAAQRIRSLKCGGPVQSRRRLESARLGFILRVSPVADIRRRI